MTIDETDVGNDHCIRLSVRSISNKTTMTSTMVKRYL